MAVLGVGSVAAGSLWSACAPAAPPAPTSAPAPTAAKPAAAAPTTAPAAPAPTAAKPAAAAPTTAPAAPAPTAAKPAAAAPTAAPAATQAPAQAAAKPLAGQKINVLHLIGGGGAYEKTFKGMVPNFEQKTGIQATVDNLAEDQEMQKVRVVLGAKSDEYDVMYYRGNLMPELVKGGSLEPLDQYIAKAKADDKTFDFEGLVPNLVGAFNFEGKQWGLPFMGGGNILYYNKDMFQAAGLTRPPKNLDELEEYAKKLNKPPQAGLTLRAKREAGINVYAWIFIWKISNPKWYDNVKGNWFDQNWQPQLASPEAISSVDRYTKMLREYGPKGVASYGWQECLVDFQQAAVAMWIDDVSLVTAVEDPKQSKVAGKIGYAVVEGPGDKYGAVAPWGFIMNVASKKKDAAWEFIKWATSNEVQLDMVKNKWSNPARTKALDAEEMKKFLPAEYVAALTKAISVADPAYKPIIPQQSEINDLVSVALSKALTGQASSADAMKEANEKVLAIMKRDGYIK